MTSEDLDILDEIDCYLLLRSRTLGRVGVRIGRRPRDLPRLLRSDARRCRLSHGTRHETECGCGWARASSSKPTTRRPAGAVLVRGQRTRDSRP
jgi:hypothetical protein